MIENKTATERITCEYHQKNIFKVVVINFDLSHYDVKEIVDFAVNEYNKESRAKLRLQKVIKGESQVVAGINYRLVIAVKNGSGLKL